MFTNSTCDGPSSATLFVVATNHPEPDYDSVNRNHSTKLLTDASNRCGGEVSPEVNRYRNGMCCALGQFISPSSCDASVLEAGESGII